eukprot:4898183-Prymnesium_polylepis.1
MASRFSRPSAPTAGGARLLPKERTGEKPGVKPPPTHAFVSSSSTQGGGGGIGEDSSGLRSLKKGVLLGFGAGVRPAGRAMLKCAASDASAHRRNESRPQRKATFKQSPKAVLSCRSSSPRCT